MKAYLKKILSDLIILIFLFFIGFKQAFESYKFTDIVLFDESYYLKHGTEFKLGLKMFWDGSFYALWYKILSLFSSDNFQLYFLNNSILLVMPALLIYIFLRVMKVQQFYSMAAAVIFILSYANLTVWPYITKFAICVILTGLIAIYKTKDQTEKILVSIYVLAILSYVRPEFTLSFYLILIIYCYYLIKNFRSEGLASLLKRLLPALPVLGLLLIYTPVTNTRSFFAFSQHFARSMQEKGEVNTSNWIYPEYMKEYFGTDNSIFKAFKNNPNLFAEHILSNFSRLKNHLNNLFPNFILPVEYEKIQYFLYGLTILLIAFAIYSLIKRIKEKRFTLFCLISVLFIIPPFISSTIIYPRLHYIIIISTLALIYTTFELSKKIKINLPLIYSFFITVFFCILILVFIPCRSSQSSIHEGNCTTLNQLIFIKNLEYKETINLLSTESGINIYLKKNYNFVSAERKNSSFREYADKNKINMILINSGIMSNPKYKDDSTFVNAIKDTSSFRKLDIPNCTSYLLVKKEMATK